MSPALTVLMSAYNEGKYIAAAIDSILGQTFGDFEFIIIDDASSDGTKAIIESFDDPRIVLIVNDENIGLTKNLNEGLRQAKGDLIARMDANDIALDRRFEKQIAILHDRSEVDLVWSGVIYITEMGQHLCAKLAPPFDESIRLLKTAPTDFPVGRNHINHPTVMFRKDAVQKLGGYSDKYEWGQDGNLWWRMLQDGSTFYFLEEALVQLRLVTFSVTSKRSGNLSLNENEYYSSICLANGYYSDAMDFMGKMPFTFRMARQMFKIAYYRLFRRPDSTFQPPPE